MIILWKLLFRKIKKKIIIKRIKRIILDFRNITLAYIVVHSNSNVKIRDFF